MDNPNKGAVGWCRWNGEQRLPLSAPSPVDPLGLFLAERTRAVADGAVSSEALFLAFVLWCKATGTRQWSMKGFTRSMEDCGYRRYRAGGAFMWPGLSMKEVA